MFDKDFINFVNEMFGNFRVGKIQFHISRIHFLIMLISSR